MYRQVRLVVVCLAFSFLALNAFAAVYKAIPADSFGNGQTAFGDKNVYKVQLVFQLENKNQAFNDGCAFMVTIPGSDDYQNVTVTNVQGLNVRDFYRDAFGNVVLLSHDIEPHSLPQNVKITMNVSVGRTKVNKSMTSAGTLAVSELFRSGENELTKAELFRLADEYRTFINSKAIKAKNRIYQQKVIDLYPIEDSVYHEAMADFAKTLAEQGFTVMMVYGWQIPEKTDYIARDFALKVVTKDCGVVLLNKTLREYSSDGTHIWWNSLPPKFVSEYEYNYIYTAAGVPVDVDGQKKLSNIVSFIDSTMYLSIGKVTAQGADKRFSSGYDKVTVTAKSKKQQKILSLKTKLSKYPDNFVMFKFDSPAKKSGSAGSAHSAQNTAAAKPSAAQSDNTAANPYIKSITFCRNVDNGKVIGPQQTFLASDTVYVFISLNSTAQTKNVSYQWLTPSGNNHFKKSATVPGNWSSYYTYTNANGKMEKGVWKFVITINGISRSASFTVQ